MSEQGWLIEGKNYDGTANYWAGWKSGYTFNTFSSDSLEAIRFARKEDAERCIRALFCYAEVAAVLHQWEAQP